MNLILSTGYRVNSKRGTLFRQWATHRLKEHLIEGYSINRERLQQLGQTIQIIHQSGQSLDIQPCEVKGLLDVISSYTQSFVQTFDGVYLYPSIEEQAAHLLYFTIKNHAFTDGNKRIGAFLFIWFSEKKKHRFKENGEVKINDNGLTALALLVAQSNPSDKELMVKLIMNLINSK